MDYFKGTKKNPTHLSVGAVVMNKKKKILCHHYQRFPWHDLGEIYILMRETIKPNESIETALSRGLREEFGAKAKIVKYLGALISNYVTDRRRIRLEKTTIYFLLRLQTISTRLRHLYDRESGSEIEWHKPSFLIRKMKVQAQRTGRSDLDEHKILEKL